MSFWHKLKLILLFCLIGSVAATLAGCGGGVSNGGGNGNGPPPPATLSLAATPASVDVSAGHSFVVVVTASESGTTATPTISLGTLPAGLTTTSTFPMSVPAGGATINFTASNSIATGDDAISISGTAGSATATTSIDFNVVSGTYGPLYFLGPMFNEVQLAQGSSISIQGQTLQADPNFTATLSVTGLPAGVTATVSPQTIEANESTFTVTLTAVHAAPIVHNEQLNIVATPTVNGPESILSYLLDVTPAGGGAGWSNQTSYVSTRATSFSAVYDPVHRLIYSSNEVWNRIDMISDTTRTVEKSISIRDPRGVDLSIDGSTVWVATGGQAMYGINTSTLQATQYILPRYSATSSSASIGWEGAQVFSLADKTVLLVFTDDGGSGIEDAAIWNPATNTLTQLSNPAAWGAVARSGDGTRIFSLGEDENETSFTYNVLAHTFSNAISLSSFGYAAHVAANYDGSRIAVAASGTTPFALYDGNFNLLSVLPGDGGGASNPSEGVLEGGIIFSPDGRTLYEETESTAVPVIASIDVTLAEPVALAPAMPVVPAMTLLSPSFYLPEPFAVDANGMLLGIEYEGIAFDDSTINFNYSALQAGTPGNMQHMSVYSGPVGGGTTSNEFGGAFSLTPDVYYGATKGIATLTSNQISLTSPPAGSPRPVDLKVLFPDGTEAFDPQFFTYGTKIQDAVISGGSPDGGAAAKLDAFGLPLDPSKDTVTIGGNNARVTSTTTQYPPFTGEQTDMWLSYTAPPGAPGWADVTVTTPNGKSTLPKSFFFAKSVTDYATSDELTFVLYDKTRNQLYLSAGNHIDVFSLSSDSFVSPLQPPASTGKKQFQGLALTPDGKYLLATNLTDYSLAAIDPDNPSNSFVVPVATGGINLPWSCPVGPLFVAADNLGNAYVVTGGAIGTTACGPGGYEAIVNLTAKASTLMNAPGCDIDGFGGYLESNADGTLVAITGGGGYGTFQMYVPAKAACIPVAHPPERTNGVTVSADGNAVGLGRDFVNPSGTLIGRIGYPKVFYPNFINTPNDAALQNPTLNDAGSLYYWAYPNYIDIVDVQKGTPALRFGLVETVANTVSPMAIDSSGQHIYLITNKGLTIIDLGTAPLSIGHFSQTTASAGAQINVRGSGFESGMTATLGGVAASVNFIDSETLTLTVPSTSTGPQDLLLSNPDGTSYTLQNAINVQ